MYVITMLVMSIYLGWGIYTRKEVFAEGSPILYPFNRMALGLYKKVLIWKIPVFQSDQVRRDLEGLYTGHEIAYQQMLFYVKKLSLIFAAIFVGTLFCTLLKLQSQLDSTLLANGILNRGEYKESVKEIVLEAQIQGREKQTFVLKVKARLLDREEADLLEEEFAQILLEKMLGDNLSDTQIWKDLKLQEEYKDYPFLIRWQSNKPGTVTKLGSVYEVQEETKVLLTAVITYQQWEWVREFKVTVVPPKWNEEEVLYKQLGELVKDSDESSLTRKEWQLPASVDGKEIVWKEQVEDYSLLMWLLLLSVGALIYFLSDKDLHSQYEIRQKQMKEAYPIIINKFALYLGAGLTIRGACMKIGEAYSASKKQGKTIHPAYEEILYTCHELSAGVSEAVAYERLGKRIGLMEYIKVCALLVQNLKKGNSTLLTRLREEALLAMQAHVQFQKKKGEEAGTKLLIPMVMMLAVIMLLIMIPAFSSMGQL
ncbi:hypothetical protein LJC58_03015 [Lachnospiraceae bacterium OttesenSCG-928-D06]|nr:hypothetical protein [Lachnospiraceae bacterium OttesenSCG-928-D06]